MTRRTNWGFVAAMIGPALVIYIALVLLPSFNAFRYSLTRWDGLSDPVSVGLKNFGRIFSQRTDFLSAFVHNLYLMFVPAVFILTLSLFFAFVLHRGVKGGRVFRIAFFFPNVISSVAVALLWTLVYSTGEVGLLNGMFKAWFGLKEPFPFTQSAHLLPSIVPMIVWTATGFYMVLFLAAMEGIPESLYEAARLDGAADGTMFRRITVPLIWEVIATGVVFLIIGGLKVLHTKRVIENGRPAETTHTLATLMYSKVFAEYDIGYGTAIAVCLFVLTLAATTLGRRLMRRERWEYS